MKKNWIIVTRENDKNTNHTKPMTWNEARRELKMCYDYATKEDWRKEFWLCEADDTDPTQPYNCRYAYSVYGKFFN